MRKRQWKKILSLVLAVAMVLTMNTSVFAATNTEVSAPSAENAAQPEDTAAPAAEAEVPAETPATETPAAETPEKTEEPAATAPEVDVNDGEQAVGDVGGTIENAPDGWATTYGSGDDSTSAWNGTTLTIDESKTVNLKLAQPEGTRATSFVVVINAGSVLNVTAESEIELGILKDYVIVNQTGDDVKALSVKKYNTAGTYTITKITASTGKFNVDDTNADYRKVSATATDHKYYISTKDGRNFESAVTPKEDKIEAGGSADLANGIIALSNATQSLYDVNTSAFTVKEIIVPAMSTEGPDVSGVEYNTETQRTSIPADNENDRQYKLYKTGETEPEWTTIAKGSDATIANLPTGAVAGDKLTLLIRYSGVEETSFPSPASEKIIDTTEPGTITVSGLKFVLGDESASFNAVSDNKTGIYTVTTEGKVNVKLAGGLGDVKPISINVAKDSVLDMASAISTGENISLEGEGTVMVNSTTTKAFDDVKGVSISTDATEGDGLILYNETANKYSMIVIGKEEAFKTNGGKLAVKSLAAAPKTFDMSSETISKTDPVLYVLSSNEIVKFVEIGGDSLKASANEIPGKSVKFGEKYIFNQAGGGEGIYSYTDVPTRLANNFPAGIVNGQRGSTGVYVNKGTAAQKALLAGTSNETKGYDFVLSTNGTATKEELEGSTYWQDNVENAIVTNLLLENTTAQPGKTYYLYARKHETNKAFKSDAKVIGSFETLKDTSISINLAHPGVSPNYAGDVGRIPDEDGDFVYNYDQQLAFFEKQASNVLNRSFFNFQFNYPTGSFSVVEDIDESNDNAYYKVKKYKNDTLYVVDGDGDKVGTITLQFKKWDGSAFTEDVTKNLYELEPGKYQTRIKFVGDGGVGAAYGTMEYAASNSVSFDVIKAPVKYEPVLDENPAVSGSDIPHSFKATNKVTGAVLDNDVVFSGLDASYFIDGVKASTDATSWNALKAGTYKITVSAGNLTSTKYFTEKEDTENTDYSTEASLTVVDAKDKTNGFKVSGTIDSESPVYFGSGIAAVKAAVVPKYTLGEVDITDKYAYMEGNVVVLSEPSENAANVAVQLTDEKLSSISADETVYAYILNAQYGGATVSSAAIPVKIAKRPIDIVYDGGATISSYRGDDLLKVVSANKLVGTVYEPYANEYLYTKDTNNKQFTGSKLLDASQLVDVALDTSVIDKNSPTDTYGKDVLIAATLSSNLLKNYTIGKHSVKYVINGRYYVKYILEYGGKKYVKTTIVDKNQTAASENKGYGDFYTIHPGDFVSESWNGVLDNKKAKITGWKVQNSEFESVGTLYTRDAETSVTLTSYDYFVYAIVTAIATRIGDDSAVMVESLVPVEYDGTQHVLLDDKKANKRGDLGELVLYDTSDVSDIETGNYTHDMGDGTYAYVLENKKDYTVSYKNNQKASVAYDPTVSGDSTEKGKDATFKQLFDEKQRPQVIVKGKGNYKGMTATVYFDILPKAFSQAGSNKVSGICGIDTFYLPNKTLNVKAKPTSWVWTNYEKNKDKTYTLKEGKLNSKTGLYTNDFKKTIYKVTYDATGTNITSKTEVTDFKKIAEGKYIAVIEAVNNYRGTATVPFEVKTGYLLSKQTFKWTKKVDWSNTIAAKTAYDVVANDLKVAITDKQKKAAVNIVKADAEAAGVTMTNIAVVRNKVPYTVADDGTNYDKAEDYKFVNAGVYKITFTPNEALKKANSLYGTHTIQVELKGVKLTAKDFVVNGGKALEYTGKADKLVTVALKNPNKFKEDEYSKIPLKNTAKNVKAVTDDYGKNAITAYADKYANGKGEVYTTEARIGELKSSYRDNDGYTDMGSKLSAKFIDTNKYTVEYVADNANIGSYYIYIVPTGKFYADGGYVRLTYTRAGLDIGKSSAVKVVTNKVKANIGGTPASFRMSISGNAPDDSYVSDNRAWVDYTGTGSKADTFEYGNFKFKLAYSNNKKAGTATLTIKPDTSDSDTKKWLKGTLKTTYTIEDKAIEGPIPMVGAAKEANAVYADVADVVAPKSGSPKTKVTLYQVTADGSAYTKLKEKTDFEWKLGSYVSTNATAYSISVNAPEKGSFKFIDEKNKNGGATLATAEGFNVFDQKGKIKVTLSEGKAAGCVYDSAKKGYIYTGSAITPNITKIEVNGTTYYNSAVGTTTSNNFIVKYDKNISVGTATATVTLTRNYGDLTKVVYPYGGSVNVKFKIIPQKSEDVILEK